MRRFLNPLNVTKVSQSDDIEDINNFDIFVIQVSHILYQLEFYFCIPFAPFNCLEGVHKVLSPRESIKLFGIETKGGKRKGEGKRVKGKGIRVEKKRWKAWFPSPLFDGEEKLSGERDREWERKGKERENGREGKSDRDREGKRVKGREIREKGKGPGKGKIMKEKE